MKLHQDMLNTVFCFCSKNLCGFFSIEGLKKKRRKARDLKQFKLQLWSLRTELKIALTSSVLTGRPGYYCRSAAKALHCKSA